MKNKRQIMRLLGLRIWDATPFTRRLKLYGYRRLLGLENPISIHSHVLIDPHHCLGGVNPSFSAGRDCVINDHVSIDITGSVMIGNRVLMAEDVIIYTHSHNKPNLPKEHTEATSLVIGDDVFIGTRAIILSSCHHIGNNVIIGAGAVVTRDIPDNSVAVGVPAKVVKQLAI